MIPEGLTEGALALLVLDRFVSVVKTLRGKPNGHSEVRPQDAPEFFLLQRDILGTINRVEKALGEIREEVLNDRVKQHHRERD